MSLEPPSSSGLPGRSRPALSDLSRETTEGDLWNLDDERADSTLSTVDYPPQPRMGLDPNSKREEPAETPPAKARGRTPDPMRPDPEDPSGRKMGRPVPVDEIGDLEDDGEQDEIDHDEPEGTLHVIPEREAGESPAPVPQAPPADPAGAETAPDLTRPALLAGETGSSKPNQRRGESTPQRPATAGTPAGSLPRPRLNRREVIGLAAFAFTLLLAAIWVLTRFFSAFEFKSEFVTGPDFPVQGERVQLERAETFWREPVRTGESRDFARREVTMIPVLELTLDPDKTTGGTLLVIFRNSEGEPVGDSIRRSFTGSHFDSNGLATIAFPSTDGFVAEGDFNAYRAGKGNIWMAEVFEGPSIDAPANQFKLVASIPVLPKLR